MRILYITTIGGTMTFFKSFVSELVEQGHTVDIACNDKISAVPEIYKELGSKIYTISCTRSPLKFLTLKAIKELREIVKENGYDIVHCHSPIAAMCTRLACKKLRKKTGLKVVYTAHGFHFYKGAPKKNWLLYYPIEKLCAKHTDLLITINQEDYELASKKLKAKKVVYVPGVGIDVAKFANAVVDVKAKREELGVPADAFVLTSVGELNENKNHQVVIRAIAKLNNKNIHFILAGKGCLEEKLRCLSKDLGVEKQVHLLGYRTDIVEIYKASNVSIFPSIREGLGLAAVEGMSAGLPIIVSDNRGSASYAKNNENAFVCKYNDVDGFALAIDKLYKDKELCERWGKINKEQAQIYEVKEINKIMHDLYREI